MVVFFQVWWIAVEAKISEISKDNQSWTVTKIIIEEVFYIYNFNFFCLIYELKRSKIIIDKKLSESVRLPEIYPDEDNILDEEGDDVNSETSINKG